MCKHRTPAARFRFSGDGGAGVGSQNHTADHVALVKAARARWMRAFPMRTIYFVAGEVSADNHGASLMRCLRELDPTLKFIGRGGPQMQEVAGKQFNNWIGDAAVLGLWEVIRKYGYFQEQFRQTTEEIVETEPDA